MSSPPFQRVLYYDKRHSVVLIASVTFAEAIFAIGLVHNPLSIPLWLSAVAFALLLLCLYSMEIVIESEGISIRYGIGFFGQEIDFSLIQTATVAGMSSAMAWIFDPLSPESLVLHLRSGEKISLGTPDRRQIIELIRGQVDSR